MFENCIQYAEIDFQQDIKLFSLNRPPDDIQPYIDGISNARVTLYGLPTTECPLTYTVEVIDNPDQFFQIICPSDDSPASCRLLTPPS